MAYLFHHLRHRILQHNSVGFFRSALCRTRKSRRKSDLFSDHFFCCLNNIKLRRSGEISWIAWKPESGSHFYQRC
uniref:Uncharacterized protein n=1 Tax=uncultured marine virus TaxID=186617 RepID=A0A0F7L3R8_9VIRU|nr:hypothetical protein [uncultured marine virus]